MIGDAVGGLFGQSPHRGVVRHDEHIDRSRVIVLTDEGQNPRARVLQLKLQQVTPVRRNRAAVDVHAEMLGAVRDPIKPARTNQTVRAGLSRRAVDYAAGSEEGKEQTDKRTVSRFLGLPQPDMLARHSNMQNRHLSLRACDFRTVASRKPKNCTMVRLPYVTGAPPSKNRNSLPNRRAQEASLCAPPRSITYSRSSPERYPI